MQLKISIYLLSELAERGKVRLLTKQERNCGSQTFAALSRMHQRSGPPQRGICPPLDQ